MTKQEEEALLASLPDASVEMDADEKVELSDLLQGEVCGWCGEPLSGTVEWVDEQPVHEVCREAAEAEA